MQMLITNTHHNMMTSAPSSNNMGNEVMALLDKSKSKGIKLNTAPLERVPWVETRSETFLRRMRNAAECAVLEKAKGAKPTKNVIMALYGVQQAKDDNVDQTNEEFINFTDTIPKQTSSTQHNKQR